jgi:hypothetical protein
MININTAKNPRVLLNSFFSFLFFRLRFFFVYIYNTQRPHRFHWNFHKSIANSYIRTWNNIVSSKNKKEERTYNINHYLNLLRG